MCKKKDKDYKKKLYGNGSILKKEIDTENNKLKKRRQRKFKKGTGGIKKQHSNKAYATRKLISDFYLSNENLYQTPGTADFIVLTENGQKVTNNNKINCAP